MLRIPLGRGHSSRTACRCATPAPPTPRTHRVQLTLPTDVTFASASPGCAAAAGVVTCSLGDLSPSSSGSASVVVLITGLVYINGGAEDIAAQAIVCRDGTDSNPPATPRLPAGGCRWRRPGHRRHGNRPTEVLIGSPGSCRSSVTIANAGPSSPIDTVLTTSASGSGVAVAPATSTSEQRALATGNPRPSPRPPRSRAPRPG